MKISPKSWSIRQLINSKSKIDPKPQYQRSSVWTLAKKKLLIDSILRGYDLPKFYLVQNRNPIHHEFEVADGQQRMRAIWDFFEEANGFVLDEFEIEDEVFKNLSYKEIKKNHKDLHNHFLDFKIDIALITNASPEEIRLLFARLQMGERLNSAELRNAIASNIGNAINSIVETHKFFKDETRIKNTRFKHQEYLDNALAAAYYDATKDIKAPNLKEFYYEHAKSSLHTMQPLLKKTTKILETMRKMNSFKKGIFRNKWAFVDVFYLLYRTFDTYSDVNANDFADNFQKFDQKRITYVSEPDKLIDGTKSVDRGLYDYLLAFKTGGAEKKNLSLRHQVLHRRFFNETNFTMR